MVQEEAADRERPGSLLRVNPGGEIRFGGLEIHPGLEYRFIYDDNIFKDRSGKVDDLINQVTPSIGFKPSPWEEDAMKSISTPRPGSGPSRTATTKTTKTTSAEATPCFVWATGSS